MGDDVTEWDNPVHVERKCPLCGATRTRFVDVYSDGDEVVECSFGRQKCNGCGLSCKHWDAIDALTAENAELRKVLGNLTQEVETWDACDKHNCANYRPVLLLAEKYGVEMTPDEMDSERKAAFKTIREEMAKLGWKAPDDDVELFRLIQKYYQPKGD